MPRNVGLQSPVEVPSARRTRFLFSLLVLGLVLTSFVATVHLKRLPVMPREARVVKATPDSVETLRPIPYDTRI